MVWLVTTSSGGNFFAFSCLHSNLGLLLELLEVRQQALVFLFVPMDLHVHLLQLVLVVLTAAEAAGRRERGCGD